MSMLHRRLYRNFLSSEIEVKYSLFKASNFVFKVKSHVYTACDKNSLMSKANNSVILGLKYHKIENTMFFLKNTCGLYKLYNRYVLVDKDNIKRNVL